MNPLSDRRFTFNQVALDYDAVRPTYPEALVEDILTISALPVSGKIIEVGCGSGQATLPFARQGYSLTCLDIGPELLKLAVQKCQDFPRVHFLCTSFEDWQPEDEKFDLLLSATAFHWIPPEIGYPKAAAVLKDSGLIALIWQYHPKPFTDFFLAVQEIYRRIVPEWADPTQGPSLEEDIHSTVEEINQTGLFEPVMAKTYLWTKDFCTSDFLKLLNTYSDHYNLEESLKRLLFSEIGALIDHHYGGRITRPYLTALFIASKKTASGKG